MLFNVFMLIIFLLVSVLLYKPIILLSRIIVKHLENQVLDNTDCFTNIALGSESGGKGLARRWAVLRVKQGFVHQAVHGLVLWCRVATCPHS